MAETEREIRAQQHQDRVDLTTNHEREWTKFRQKQEEYNQKYGIGYAKTLLNKERQTLENRFNQEISHLAEFHDQQWLDHENNTLNDKPYTLPSYLKEPEQTQVTPQQLQSHPSKALFRNPATNPHQSQEKLNDLLSKQKEKQGEKENETQKEISADTKSMSMSQRFNQGLSYTQVAEKTDKSPAKVADKGMDRD